MKTCILLICLVATSWQVMGQQTIPPADVQIKTAVLAAPADKRAGATVIGYTKQGQVAVLRKGTNEMICLADDPMQKGFSVSCYHKDLEPFMARGRELRQQGKDAKAIFDMREQEAKNGKLKLPEQPSTLFVFNAADEDVDPVSGEVKNGYLRYVVYIPFATAESTGLPLKPEAPAMPWIMYPGTHAAHIMINPPAARNR